MIPNNPQGNSSPAVMPPSGAQQCIWTGGYAQGTTQITLNSCAGGAGPPVGQILILDQANDNSSDTGGVYICDSYLPGCTTEGSNANANGRQITGTAYGTITHSQKQLVLVQAVSGSGTGPYTVTISPGVAFTNVRVHPEYAGDTYNQYPGAYWPNTVQNDGLENLSVDYSQQANPCSPYASTNCNLAVAMFNCYQCWVKNVRTLKAARDHIFVFNSLNSVIRDNYLYSSIGTGSQSYGVEMEGGSGVLIENNIMQQTVNPVMFGQGAGSVVGYNFSVYSIYAGSAPQTNYYHHNAGNEMNLWEGNNALGIWTDLVWGTSTQGTVFRNLLTGWQSGKTKSLYATSLRAGARAFNYLGNVLGQPNFHTIYEAYATSGSTGQNLGTEQAIYNMGWNGNSADANCLFSPPACDPLVHSTLMRWGNYDVVTGATKWDSTEASPPAVPYVNANFTSSYFSSLAHTLPASLYYPSKPSWWPATKAWPPVGPDVSSGNVGICSGGTYAGAQATASGQCTGGTWSSAWAGHANSIPAQDCYLNVMQGPPDGTGNVLNFDASLCYGSTRTGPAPPTGLRVSKVQ
jgi:hypothetical protein